MNDVLKHLDALGAEYQAIECDPNLADTADFCAAYGYALDESANAILIASKRPPGQFALCLALATTRLDVNRAVRDVMGVKKLSFATPEQTIDATGMMIGGVTPFGVACRSAGLCRWSHHGKSQSHRRRGFPFAEAPGGS